MLSLRRGCCPALSCPALVMMLQLMLRHLNACMVGQIVWNDPRHKFMAEKTLPDIDMFK